MPKTATGKKKPGYEVSEKGSFAHAVCRACGWRGPARRSRGRAKQDGDEHGEKSCSTKK